MNEHWQDPSIDDQEAPTWPKVVGISSISWAVVNLGCVGCGFAGLLIPSIMSNAMQQAYPDGMPPTYSHPPVEFFITMAFGVVMSFILICAGIMLLLRKPSAKMMHIVYGIGGIISGIVGTYVHMAFQAEINEWIQQNPDTAFAKKAVAGQALQQAMLIVAIVVAFAWPTFCLIWFGAVKKDAQEIARGVETLV